MISINLTRPVTTIYDFLSILGDSTIRESEHHWPRDDLFQPASNAGYGRNESQNIILSTLTDIIFLH